MTARQTENGPKHYFDESRQNLLGWLIKVELWHNAANYTNIEPMICSSFVVLLRIWSSLDRGGYPGETLDEFVAAKPAGCDNVECNTLGSAKMARLEGQCGDLDEVVGCDKAGGLGAQSVEALRYRFHCLRSMVGADFWASSKHRVCAPEGG